MSKLILLNGFAGVGKSTIARMYIEQNPLTLAIDGDQVMGMIGGWRQKELKARDLKFSLITAMISTHLKSGRDVVLPYLVTDSTHVTVFEEIAEKCSAEFHELILWTDKVTAVKRLLERGRWGEEGSKQLTKEDISRIERLYEMMISEYEKRPNMTKIISSEGGIENTYKIFLDLVLKSKT